MVLVMNAAFLIAVLFEVSQASSATRLQLAQVGFGGVACVMLLRALKVSRDLTSRIRKLVDINRLFY